VDEITEASVNRVASIGEAYLHTSPAKDGKPVIIVTSTNHFPNVSFLTLVIYSSPPWYPLLCADFC